MFATIEQGLECYKRQLRQDKETDARLANPSRGGKPQKISKTGEIRREWNHLGFKWALGLTDAEDEAIKAEVKAEK